MFIIRVRPIFVSFLYEAWTFQILGISRNSRKWPSFCAKRCQIDQNSLVDSISLKFIQNQWVVDVAGYKVSAWHVVLFSVFDVQKRQELPAKLPQKSVKLPQKTSNSRKSRKVIQTIFFWNPPDHIVDCKPYDKCKVTEKFVATPGILNFTRKQEMLEISRKRMLQGAFNLSLGPASKSNFW